ncbi:MAG: hypothetical protein ACTS1X_10445 [Parasphingopyxis sp.]|uniref:hypothetical protein n=1 Tax=Parasphingopyxis sp. TaxID=1920299 RepID=UPI003FA0342C
MDMVTLIGSLAAVFMLAAIAWWLGMGKAVPIADDATALRLARDAQSGFEPAAVARDRRGGSALVAGEDGSFLLIRPHGARVAARMFRAPPAISRDGGKLKIHSGERMFGDVMLDLGEAEAQRWADQLENARHA